jgi:DNA-binding response OmpR family regulator
MAKLLFVEDDSSVSDVVLDLLKSERYLVEHVDTGNEAIYRLRFYEYDAVILDWKLPDISGLDVLKNFRAAGGKTPVIMLTGKREVDDKATGLDSGADDYLTKPFHPMELSARVRALLRRPSAMVGEALEARDILLDPKTHRVTRGDQEIALLPKEFSLLEFFMRHPNTVFTADALLARVWATDSEATSGTIRININRLRSKIDVAGQPSLITTVYGVGYRFDP